MPSTQLEGKYQMREAKTVVIFKEDGIEVYEVPEDALKELPESLSPDEVDWTVKLVEKNGILREKIRPDYTIDSRVEW